MSKRAGDTPGPGGRGAAERSRVVKRPRLVSEAVVVGPPPSEAPRAPQPSAAEPEAVIAAARAAAARLLAEARARLEAAQAEAEQIREAARAAGYTEGLAAGRAEGQAQGYAEGLARAEAEARQQVEALRRLAENVRVEWARLVREAEEEVVRLALAIAEKVIRHTLAVDPQALAALVRAALEQVALTGTVRLRVHPQDWDALSRHWPAVQPTVGEGSYEIVADEQVRPGGCLIEAGPSRIDAQVETQLAAIRRALLGADEEEQP